MVEFYPGDKVDILLCRSKPKPVYFDETPKNRSPEQCQEALEAIGEPEDAKPVLVKFDRQIIEDCLLMLPTDRKWLLREWLFPKVEIPSYWVSGYSVFCPPLSSKEEKKGLSFKPSEYLEAHKYDVVSAKGILIFGSSRHFWMSKNSVRLQQKGAISFREFVAIGLEKEQFV